MKSPDDIRRLEQLAKQAPRNVKAWIDLGNSLTNTSRFSEAVDAYQKALALDLKNLDVRVDMGISYRGLRKPEKAMKKYRKAIKINSNHVNAHRNMAMVYTSDLHEKQKAIKKFEKYLELAPNASDTSQIRQTVIDLKALK
jgi:tetratricopeptide (TPR) repeat protein